MRAEWTKLRTVTSSAWLLAGAAASMVALGAAITVSITPSHCVPPTDCLEDTAKLSLAGVWLGQVAVVALAVLAMTNEYATRMIQTTLGAEPRRGLLLAAKAAVVTATALLAGALGVVGSVLAARNILPGGGFTAANGYPPLSLADGPTLRAAGGTALYLGLIALLSLGMATIVRDTAGAITAVLLLLFATPMVAAFVSDPVWQDRLERFSPMTAGLAIQSTRSLETLPIAPWAGLGVLAAYAMAAIAIGTVVFRFRDA
jgi:ABC-2 type transport system permease protein